MKSKAIPADILRHRTFFRLDQGDARLERGLVRVKAFGVFLAISVACDRLRARWRGLKSVLVGHNTAGAVPDCSHRLPVNTVGTGGESDEDEQLHGGADTQRRRPPLQPPAKKITANTAAAKGMG